MLKRLLVPFSISAAAALGGPVDYSRDIQPLLSENCYHCHGPDAKAREAKLRLDVRDGPEGAYRTDSGITVVKPGDSKGSELVSRIFATDEDDVMPPPKSHRTLTAAQKELLKRWVEEGAKWGEHWAFVAPKRPAAPGKAELEAQVAELGKRDAARAKEIAPRTAEFAKWPRNPVDAFVLARQIGEGLTPSPETDKTHLLRRATLDLTGLPPTPEELDAFLADQKPDAYERAVDRLLASPRYGERMVWEWLDAARYADTNGYQGDPTRAMWYWRDWAVEALNKNMPFDQFTIEQLAGDLLPNPTPAQLIATGFHRNHMINGEGGRIAEESRVDYVFDRVETTGAVWMGLTLTCCRCHDHKYDPIKQKEYYQLAAYFNSIEETGGGGNDGQGLANPTISLASPEQQKKVETLKAAEVAVKKEREDLEKKLREQQPEWEKSLLAGTGKPMEVKWHVLTPDELYADNGTKLAKLDDGSVLASGPNPAKEGIVFVANSKIGAITGFRLEMLPDPSFEGHGPGRADNGNFVLTEITLQGSGKPVELGAVSVDFIQNPTHVASTVFDGKQDTGWAVMPEFGKPHTLIFEARNQVGYGNDVLLSFRLDCKSGHVSHTLGRFRLSATTDNRQLLRPMPDKIRTMLAKPTDQRSDAEKKEIAQFYFDTHPSMAGIKDRQEAAKKARESAEQSAPRTMVMRERAQPRKTTILVKGAYNVPGEEVQHGVPARLPQLAGDAPKNRLALARWLMSPEHPLTARVTVNRLWAQIFGQGLVKSAEDFGVQGDKPTHPELLDWLAVEFRESGWDMKKLVRLMVTSATYRQSGQVPPGMAERDPENKWLARGSRYRWPSWMLRDQALAVSGLLVEKVGGPPVKGYQPEGIWEDATFGQIRYKQDKGEALYRRSLYIFWRRIVGPTMFFDVSNRQNCTVKVGRTNTPLHALATMNDVTYVEAARALAQRTLLSASAKDDASRVTEMFRRCTARVPLPEESELLLKRLGTLRNGYAQDGDAAKKLIAAGESKADAKVAPAELASWTGVALLVLNLDETLSKE
jgi:hypothetical protein